MKKCGTQGREGKEVNEQNFTVNELTQLLDTFGGYTENRSLRDFVESSMFTTATEALVHKAMQDGCQPGRLVQLVAWGVFMAEKGKTKLTTEVH